MRSTLHGRTTTTVAGGLFFFVGCPVAAALLWAPGAAADDAPAPVLPELVAATTQTHQSPDIQHVTDRWDKVSVYSPSMNTVIVNDVYKAANPGAPTFYLLPGIDGGDDLDPGTNFAPGTKSWFGMTDIQGFFADKNVNVVSPLGGQFSWWTNWINDPAKQYQTYMTSELPPVINATYQTNGVNAVGGLSSTGGTAIDYAVQAPGQFRAVGSYSGFPAVSDPPAPQEVAATLMGGGQSAENMWGPLGGPGWVAHDPAKNVDQLRGVAVYAAASGGGQGAVDKLAPNAGPNITGGMIEGIVADSTEKFAEAAKEAGVPVNYVVMPQGSHTWGLFEAEMQDSWNTTIGPALGQ